MSRLIPILLLLFILLGVLNQNDVHGQDMQSTLFESDEVVAVVLKTDFKKLFDDRGDDPKQQPATLSYTDEEGSEHTQELKVRLRGNFRKKHCNFPPIRLNFAKKEAEGTLFEGEDKLKLVTHCQDKKEEYEQYVLMEYLAYRMYNELTDLSFRVRLVRVTYEDSEGNRKPLTRYGFLIEDDELMAQRNNGFHLDEHTGYHQESTDYSQILKMSVFQYMIGNTDWSVPALHNIRLVSSEEVQLPIAVPYDFDFSGLVNTNYASPSPKLPIKTVRQRLYRGYCRPQEELAEQVEVFQAKKEQFYMLIKDMKPLSRVARGNAIDYLNDFYKTISTEKRIRRAFQNTCQQL